MASLELAYAVVQPGLEQTLVDELREAGINARAEGGGAIFDASLSALHRVHLHARIPTRVWVRLGAFRATSLDVLGREVTRLAWSSVVHARQPIECRVTSHHSRLRHRDRIARKVTLAVGDALRGPRRPGPRRRGPPPPPAKVLVRIDSDEVEVSIDASGEPLYRRGWRQHVGEAPLRENLAAAVLRLAGWSPGEPLVDPMCGSGTFCVEAATIAAGRPPGAHRRFAFEAWPTHDERAWQQARKMPPVARGPGAPIFGSDQDEAVIRAAQSNAARAKVGRRVGFQVRPVQTLTAPADRGLVVCNPPWGDRIQRAETAWKALGATLHRAFAGWRVVVLVPRPALGRALGLSLSTLAQFPAGGIRISVCSGVVPG